MDERTKLLKKAVMTGVGASTSVDRIKTALDEAMRDLLKVGQDLVEDLEETGKVKTESIQDFLKNLKNEAAKRTTDVEKTVSSEVKKAARDIGLVMHEDLDEICERLCEIEEALGITEEGETGNGESPKQKSRGKHKKSHS